MDEATPPKAPTNRLQGLGWTLIVVGALLVIPAFAMDTGQDVTPSPEALRQASAAGVDLAVQHVANLQLLFRQLVYAVVGSGCIVAGAVFVTGRR